MASLFISVSFALEPVVGESQLSRGTGQVRQPCFALLSQVSPISIPSTSTHREGKELGGLRDDCSGFKQGPADLQEGALTTTPRSLMMKYIPK